MSSQTDILRKLIKTTEKSAVAAQKLAGEFMTKGREQAESVMSMVESEVEKQLARIGFATMAELGKLEARIDALTSKASASVASKSAAPKPVAAKTVAAKTVAAKPVAAGASRCDTPSVMCRNAQTPRCRTRSSRFRAQS